MGHTSFPITTFSWTKKLDYLFYSFLTNHSFPNLLLLDELFLLNSFSDPVLLSKGLVNCLCHFNLKKRWKNITPFVRVSSHRAPIDQGVRGASYGSEQESRNGKTNKVLPEEISESNRKISNRKKSHRQKQ